jgi:hypothetical protein
MTPPLFARRFWPSAKTWPYAGSCQWPKLWINNPPIGLRDASGRVSGRAARPSTPVCGLASTAAPGCADSGLGPAWQRPPADALLRMLAEHTDRIEGMADADEDRLLRSGTPRVPSPKRPLRLVMDAHDATSDPPRSQRRSREPSASPTSPTTPSTGRKTAMSVIRAGTSVSPFGVPTHRRRTRPQWSTPRPPPQRATTGSHRSVFAPSSRTSAEPTGCCARSRTLGCSRARWCAIRSRRRSRTRRSAPPRTTRRSALRPRARCGGFGLCCRSPPIHKPPVASGATGPVGPRPASNHADVDLTVSLTDAQLEAIAHRVAAMIEWHGRRHDSRCVASRTGTARGVGRVVMGHATARRPLRSPRSTVDPTQIATAPTPRRDSRRLDG